MWGPSLRWAAERSMWSVPNSLLCYSLLFRVWWIGWQKSKETWHIGHLTYHLANRSSWWNTICSHNSLTSLPGIGHRPGPTLWWNVTHCSTKICPMSANVVVLVTVAQTAWPHKVIPHGYPTRWPHHVTPQGAHTRWPQKVLTQGDPTWLPHKVRRTRLPVVIKRSDTVGIAIGVAFSAPPHVQVPGQRGLEVEGSQSLDTDWVQSGPNYPGRETSGSQGEETVFLRCCLLGHLLCEAHHCGDGVGLTPNSTWLCTIASAVTLACGCFPDQSHMAFSWWILWPTSEWKDKDEIWTLCLYSPHLWCLYHHYTATLCVISSTQS